MSTINQVYEFGASADPSNILSNAAYSADAGRTSGHEPGIARQALENAALRNLSRFCKGVAEFIAERYAAGVVDDGDQAKIVAGMTAAVNSLILSGGNFAVAGGTADALTATIASSLSSLSDGMTILVRASAANATITPTLNLTLGSTATGAKPIVKGNLLPLSAGDIQGAGHVLLLQYNSTADKWVLFNPANGLNSRIRLGANLTLYVATTGSDTTNNGLSAGSPFATIQHAYDVLKANYDLCGYTATIQVADGTYTAGLSCTGPLMGQAGAAGLILQGNTGAMSNVIISTSVDCITLSGGSAMTVQYVKMITSNGNAINVTSLSTLRIGNVNFGAAYGNHMIVSGSSKIFLIANYTISGGTTTYAHMQAYGSASIQANGVGTVTITGTPAWGYGFAFAYDGASMYIPGITFSGSATGARYIASTNGVINTAGSGASYLPGSVAGSTATGGQYA